MNDQPNPLVEYFDETFGLTFDNIYWGEFHAHTRYSADAKRLGDAPLLDRALKYAKSISDEIGGPELDFLALNDHAEMPTPECLAELKEQYPDAVDPYWQSTLDHGRRACIEKARDERDIFIFYPGWEYTNSAGMPVVAGSRVGYGHKNVVFRTLNRRKLPQARYGGSAFTERYPENIARTARELWKLLEPYRPHRPGEVGEALTIMHTPAKEGISTNDHSSDIEMMDPDFVRNLEIYSQHGSSEGACPKPGCRCEKDGLFNDIDTNNPNKTARAFLTEKWCRKGDPDYLLSFVAGTDNHMSRPGTVSLQHEAGTGGPASDKFLEHIMDYWGGKAGIVAKEKTRDSIWESLWNRHTLGSSGHKIRVLFSVQVGDRHLFMGDHLEELPPPEESRRDKIAVHLRAVADPAVCGHAVERLELVHNGCMVNEFPGSAMDIEYELNPRRRHYIYVRAVLDDQGRRPGEHEAPRRARPGNRAWTSPVYLGKPRSDPSGE